MQFVSYLQRVLIPGRLYLQVNGNPVTKEERKTAGGADQKVAAKSSSLSRPGNSKNSLKPPRDNF